MTESLLSAVDAVTGHIQALYDYYLADRRLLRGIESCGALTKDR